MAMAVFAIALSQFHGLTRRGVYSLPLQLLFFAAVTLAFWLLGSFDDAWTLRALYVWTGLVGTLAGLQFWLLLGELYTVTQAKRLYKLVGAGSVLGAVAGAGVARMVAEVYPADRLVLAAVVAMVLTAIGPALWVGRPAAGAPPRAVGARVGIRARIRARPGGPGAAARAPVPAEPGRPGADLHDRADPGRLRLQEHGGAHGAAGSSSARSWPPST